MSSCSRVLECLAAAPMRLRQIAVRVEAEREKIAEACEQLMKDGHVTRDEEAFFFLREPTKH